MWSNKTFHSLNENQAVEKRLCICECVRVWNTVPPGRCNLVCHRMLWLWCHPGFPPYTCQSLPACSDPLRPAGCCLASNPCKENTSKCKNKTFLKPFSNGTHSFPPSSLSVLCLDPLTLNCNLIRDKSTCHLKHRKITYAWPRFWKSLFRY